jgi:adenylate cyclase
MADIFISYAHSTAKQAQAAAQALKELGYSVWLDDELPAHRAYSRVIEEQLVAATAALVIWSADAVKSEWVLSEANRAREDGKLVQLTIDKTRLPMPFDQIQCAEVVGWTGDTGAPGWRKVVASIADLSRAAATGTRTIPFTAVAAKPAEHLLAVLAFDNLSGDADMTYFSDGVSEEILQTVARGAALKVIGRGSSFQFRGADKAAAHVATALKATHVLDGSVRRSGTKVRIAANLIECAGQTTLWSDRFDRELSDVFALQDEIASAVADALKIAFAPAAQSDSVDPAAYNLYLKALEIRNRGLEPDTRRAVIKLLEEATDLAPKFARAWVFLATMLAGQLRFDEPDQPRGVVRAKVVAAAETALRLDPSLGGAYQALGQLEPFANYAEREALHRRALSVAPNDPTVLTNASLFFTEIGRIRDGLEYAKRAYDLDPMYPWAANWYAQMLGYAGQVEECFELIRKLCVLWPDNELIAWNAFYAAGARGDWAWFDELERAAHERKLDSASVHRAISWCKLVREPNPETQQRYLKRARDVLADTGFASQETYTTMFRLGLQDEAFDLVNRGSFAFMFDPEQRSPRGNASDGAIFAVLFNKRIMSDIRFVGICAKLALCDYWVKTDRWPDCVEAVAPYYDFKAEARRLAKV